MYRVCTFLSLGALKTIALFLLSIPSKNEVIIDQFLVWQEIQEVGNETLGPWGFQIENHRFMVMWIESRQFIETTEKDLDGYYWEGFATSTRRPWCHSAWMMSDECVFCAVLWNCGKARQIYKHWLSQNLHFPWHVSNVRSCILLLP